MEPIYVARAGGIRWINAVLLISAVLLLAGGVIASITVPDEALEIWLVVVISLATIVFIWIILPRRYEVWPDRLRIVFPLTLHWDLGFDTIASPRVARSYEPYAYNGLRFATAPGQAITLERRGQRLLGRPGIVISPVDREAFLKQLEQAIARYQGRP
jgi:hypothetical protein